MIYNQFINLRRSEMSSKHPATPLLDGTYSSLKRQEIKNYFSNAQKLYESLFSLITDERGYFIKAEPLRHPLIFYYGHTAVFFINKLMLGQYISKRINADFESMFAVGVDEMSWDDLSENNYSWPSISEVKYYRQQVDSLVHQLIDTMPLELPVTQDSLAWLILMGIEHIHIHLETSSVILRMLPLAYLQSNNKNWTPCTKTTDAPINEFIKLESQTLTLGRTDQSIYGWDNEFGSKTSTVKAFAVSKYLVSNQEFLEFVNENGYKNKEFWSEEGWEWKNFTQAEMPHFWFFKNNVLWQRNLFNVMPLPLDWPVEVNYHEAKAFCAWKSMAQKKNFRLPSESEWMLMRSAWKDDSYEWNAVPANICLNYYASSCPINLFGNSGLYDVIGNVWQWTESSIDAYPGFKVHPLYDDFTVPTLDGKHHLIKGGSWISMGNLATKNARYAFRKHFFQHAGFRYVEAESLDPTPHAIYETDNLVSQYLDMHFGDSYFSTPNFPKTCIEVCKVFFLEKSLVKALDLGCAVGRSAFELARYFNEVDAIDFSARFIQQAVKIQQHEHTSYTLTTEGELVEYKEVALPTELIPYKNKISFVQGDACNLKPQFRNYNFIFCGNLLDRLYDPQLFLQEITQRVAKGGILALTSPYTWLEDFTPKAKWIGSRRIDAESVTTFAALQDFLKPYFNLQYDTDVPFVIRETKRKYQHSIAHLTIWERY